jgi:hypothetical protein
MHPLVLQGMAHSHAEFSSWDLSRLSTASTGLGTSQKSVAWLKDRHP